MSGDVTTDRYEFAKRVIKIVESDLAAGGYELVDVRVFTGGGRYQLRIYLDREGGINLDQCVAASRSLSMLLEEADLFPGPYVIEVSSPGVRRPLRTPEHFAAAVGREVDVKALDEGRSRKISGVLQSSDESGIVVALQPDRAASASEQTGLDTPEDSPTETPSTIRLAYSDIREANLDPAFDAQALIGEDRRRRKEAKRQKRRERRKKPRGRRRKGRSES